MPFEIKCSNCGKKIDAGNKISILGKWPGIFGGLLHQKKQSGKWPFLLETEIYCESCFNKKFTRKIIS